MDLDIPDNAGRTPLFEAIEHNMITISRMLVRKGVRVNVADFSGHSPLYCAVRDGNETITQILVESGKAKPDFFGKTNKDQEMDEYDDVQDDDEKLMVEGLQCSQTPLHVACLLGYSNLVSYLITTGGANPNVRGRKNYNSLWFSVLGKQSDITQYLLMNTLVEYD